MQIQTEERNVYVQYISVENYHNNVNVNAVSLWFTTFWQIDFLRMLGF